MQTHGQLIGGPEWRDTERFTIEATTTQPATPAELQVMMRRLLMEQFDLFVRIEQHETPAYRLVRARPVGPFGPGLRIAQPDCVARRLFLMAEGGGPGHIERRCTSLPLLASGFTLAEVLGRPIVDRTNLSGYFDVSLIYAPTPEELSTIWELSPDDLPPAYFSRPSIFAAMEAQLGLRLEPTQAIVDTLVIDYAQRPAATR